MVRSQGDATSSLVEVIKFNREVTMYVCCTCAARVYQKICTTENNVVNWHREVLNRKKNKCVYLYTNCYVLA